MASRCTHLFLACLQAVFQRVLLHLPGHDSHDLALPFTSTLTAGASPPQTPSCGHTMRLRHLNHSSLQASRLRLSGLLAGAGPPPAGRQGVPLGKPSFLSLPTGPLCLHSSLHIVTFTYLLNVYTYTIHVYVHMEAYAHVCIYYRWFTFIMWTLSATQVESLFCSPLVFIRFIYMEYINRY